MANTGSNSTATIVIVEDAKGIANGYKTILDRAGYHATVFARMTNKDIEKFAKDGKRFDLAIVDMVLPVEDDRKLKLEDCQYTGLRLMEKMVLLGICRRFYVITIRANLRKEVAKLCKEKGAALKFEYKLDYQAAKLVDNVADLLSTAVPAELPK
jgi:CheY-like chemotaxis protein